jgi:hypothetical protein
MGWSIGWDERWQRYIGYAVPGTCDHPGCGEEIKRGLGFVCGGDPFGGEHGCGLYFCEDHRKMVATESGEFVSLCERCANQADPFDPTPDTPEWMRHQLTDESWARWREDNAEACQRMAQALGVAAP